MAPVASSTNRVQVFLLDRLGKGNGFAGVVVAKVAGAVVVERPWTDWW